MAYFDGVDSKLDTLLENKAFTNTLSLQIEEATKTNASLTQLLVKYQQEREEALAELDKVKQEFSDKKAIEFEKTIEKAEQALKEYDSITYRKILADFREKEKNIELIKQIATTHYLSAKSYASDFMFDSAEKEIAKAVTLDETNGDYLGWFGHILYRLAKYTTALEYLTKSLAIQEEIGDKAGEGTTLNNISQIYKAQGDYTTALKYLTKSLAIQEEIGDKAGMCATLFNMGHIAYSAKDAEKAMRYWKQTYTIAKAINNAQALQALAGLAEQLGLDGGVDGFD